MEWRKAPLITFPFLKRAILCAGEVEKFQENFMQQRQECRTTRDLQIHSLDRQQIRLPELFGDKLQA